VPSITVQMVNRHVNGLLHHDWAAHLTPPGHCDVILNRRSQSV
jgi:hypothetical protein